MAATTRLGTRIPQQNQSSLVWHGPCCFAACRANGGRSPGVLPCASRKQPTTGTMSGDFNPEQKRYLEGFVSGLQIARAARGLGGNAGLPAAAQIPDAAAAQPVGPDAVHLLAQDRVTRAGGKLADQEKFKREQHPFDAYERLKAQAAGNEPPKPDDNFRWRFFGLFYCAPAQKTYMCRLRIPNGILTYWQLTGLADLAQRYAGGYS